MLSVLIPIYRWNILPLVNELMTQLNRESYDYEIIGLDDASPDPEILQRNRQMNELENCSYYTSETNRGRAKTRQTLAEKASYKWLLFLDCDTMPQRTDFISSFDLQNRNREEVIYGGVSYSDKEADPEKSLHWKYGRKRETRNAFEREKQPFSIFLQNLLIKRNIFLSCNKYLDESSYALDVQCSYNLKKISARIRHIDNPVVHKGVLLNREYVDRMKKIAQTTGSLQRKGFIPPDFTNIQKAHQKLRRSGSVKVFQKSMEMRLIPIEKKLLSGDGSLFLLDLYRLYHFSKSATVS